MLGASIRGVLPSFNEMMGVASVMGRKSR
jgi:hypothetical protein